MYTNFRIQNFRGFKDLELKDLARVNLIAGKNNVGKTALLEAIGIYSGQYDIVLTRLPEGQYRDRRNYAPIRTHDWIEWSFLFNQFNENQPIKLYGKGKFGSDTPLVGVEPLLISSPTEEIPDGYPAMRRMFAGDGGTSGGSLQFKIKDVPNFIIQHDVHEGVTAEHYIDYHQRSNPSIPVILLTTRSSINPPRYLGYFSELKQQRNTSILVKILKIFDESIVDIELLQNGLFIDNGLPQLISLASMGDGVVRIAEVVLSMSAVRDGVLLIDEIENGLHYSVQTDVWRAIAEAAKQFNVQIFATTHSREMIQAAYEAFRETPEDDFRFHRLDRDRTTGDIYPTTYDQYSMEAAMDVNAEVR